MGKLSPDTHADIERRNAEARPHILIDLALVISGRAGAVTDQQIELVAGLFCRMVPATDLPSEFAGWLTRNGVQADAAGRFFASGEWASLLECAQDAARGCEDRRPAPTIDQLRDTFAIGDEEAARLGLEKLITEACRSARRRLAEGARPGRRGRPRRTDCPWVAEGIPERTWRDREERRRKKERNALIDRVASESQTCRKSDPTSNADPPLSNSGHTSNVGPSLSNVSIKDRVEFPAEESGRLTYFDAMPEMPPAPPPAPTGAPSWALRTAEARRLAALAERLGLEFDGGSMCHPHTWWQPPTGLVLGADDNAELEGAIAAARRGEDRREAILIGEIRKAARARKAKGICEPCDRAAAPVDPDSRPPLVSADIWDAVPRRLRAAARRLAALNFRAGLAPDEAMVQGVEQARRSEALVAAVLAAHPDLDPQKVAAAAGRHWKMATREAVVVVVTDIADEERAKPMQAAVAWESVRKEFLRRVRLEAKDSSQYRPDAEAVIAMAARMIDEDHSLIEQGPFIVAHKAWLALKRAK